MNDTLLFICSVCVIFICFNLVLSVIYGKLIIRPEFDLSNIRLWGNKSVRPNYLVGIRARLTSFAGLIAFAFMVIAIVSSYNISYKDNILILNNPAYTNIVGLILGILLSMLNFRYNNKKFIDPREGINIYTK
jgi:hypothetical protein